MNLASNNKVKPFLEAYGFGHPSSMRQPGEGRIANNFILETERFGTVFLRLYPNSPIAGAGLLEYGPNRVKFEAKALSYLALHGLPVPNPIKIAGKDMLTVEIGGFIALAYPLLPGEPITQSEFSTKLISNVAAVQRQLLSRASQFPTDGTEPDGDLPYIKRIVENYLQSGSVGDAQNELRDILAFLDDSSVGKAIGKSPIGLAHGDFFFENLLHVNERITGIIDFGDAYIGSLIMDITTAAMEFSFLADEEWDADLFAAYVDGIRKWLVDNSIGFDTFFSSLLANCVRFAAHTLTLELSTRERSPISSNRYVRRFRAFKTHLNEPLRRILALG